MGGRNFSVHPVSRAVTGEQRLPPDDFVRTRLDVSREPDAEVCILVAMNLEKRKRELKELQISIARLETLIFSQSQVIAELERDGQLAAAQSGRALLLAFEKGYKDQIARREWHRTKLGWYGQCVIPQH